MPSPSYSNNIGCDLDQITAQKILREASTNAVNLRKLVLLCNTFDARQADLQDNQCIPDNEFADMENIPLMSSLLKEEFQITVVQCFSSDSDSDSDSSSELDEEEPLEIWDEKEWLDLDNDETVIDEEDEFHTHLTYTSSRHQARKTTLPSYDLVSKSKCIANSDPNIISGSTTIIITESATGQTAGYVDDIVVNAISSRLQRFGD
jgi:hypothetical protein